MADNLTDHEQLLLVRKDIQNLEKSQLEFHKEVRDSFKDLKDNYSSRLDCLEGKVSGLEATKQDFRDKIKLTNIYMKWIAVGVGIVAVAVIYHLTGYHI